MTITLPDELREKLEREAKAGRFATVDEYVADVLAGDGESAALPDPPAGARYAVTTREELAAKLVEGMNASGDVVAGPDFWEQRFRAAEARAGGRPG